MKILLMALMICGITFTCFGKEPVHAKHEIKNQVEFHQVHNQYRWIKVWRARVDGRTRDGRHVWLYSHR